MHWEKAPRPLARESHSLRRELSAMPPTMLASKRPHVPVIENPRAQTQTPPDAGENTREYWRNSDIKRLQRLCISKRKPEKQCKRKITDLRHYAMHVCNMLAKRENHTARGCFEKGQGHPSPTTPKRQASPWVDYGQFGCQIEIKGTCGSYQSPASAPR